MQAHTVILEHTQLTKAPLMAIKRGTGTIKRTHAKNYIQKEANKRFDECIKPYQTQGLNALGVDYFEVHLYQKGLSTAICTCKQTEVAAPHSTASVSLPPNVVNPESDVDETITIDYARPLFGSKSEATNLDYSSAQDFSFDDDEFDDEFVDDDEMPSRTSENLFSSSVDCGVCYRTGYLPGYSLYGWDRQVLTTYNISDVYGYHINQSKAPHRLDKEDAREGYVEFACVVPRYFRKLKYSIRNNNEVLMEEDLYQTGSLVPLTNAYLRTVAGKVITLRVISEQFTHVVLEFDLGVEPLHANIAQMSKNLDWTQFDTLGNLNVVLPMTIQEVQSSDYIYVPSRHQVLKVTDTPFLRTAGDKTLDWSVNTRVVQPQEPIKKIYRGRLLA